jgi:hypothetical protein
MNIISMETFHRCTVSRIMSMNEYTVIIPMDEAMVSRFRTCTCGKPAKDGISCKHMVIIVKSSMVEGLSRIQIMSYRWTTATGEPNTQQMSTAGEMF